MKDTTLCYVEQNGKYLMLYRNKKKNDVNGGKYVGIGGHVEKGETPTQCIIREAYEEAGLTLHTPRYRGIVTFISDIYEDEHMHLFTCDDFSGELIECNEGELSWIEKSSLDKIPMWEGDYIFLDMLTKREGFFKLRLEYEGDTLVKSTIED